MSGAIKAAAAQHRAEISERERAFEADIVLRRLAQLEQVSRLLLHLVRWPGRSISNHRRHSSRLLADEREEIVSPAALALAI